MKFLTTSSLVAVTFCLSLVQALPTGDPNEAASLERRTTTLASGSSYKTGQISSTLLWQSSGSLTSGGCDSKASISKCWAMYESATGMLESSAGRDQRIELYSWPQVPSGQTWTYSWKTYLDPSTGTTSHFFHLWQLLRRDGPGGPVVALDAKSGMAVISDSVRSCGDNCGSIPISQYTGKTIIHTLTVKYGGSGTLSYTAVDAAKPSTTLLKYSATGDMGSNGSLKFGLYRAAGVSGITAARASVGDYSAKKH